MRWGVEYQQNDGGMIGLILFSAEDLKEANDYVDNMSLLYGFTHVANLKLLTDRCDVAELRRLFPGHLSEKCRKHRFGDPLEKID